MFAFEGTVVTLGGANVGTVVPPGRIFTVPVVVTMTRFELLIVRVVEQWSL